jgi:hypothetical protein
MRSTRPPLRTAAVVLVSTLALASCSGDEPTERTAADGSVSEPAPVLTWEEFPGEEAAIVGRLGGSPDDGGCLWLERGEHRSAVLWPPGSQARFDPPQLLDAEGRVVASEGDTIVGGGGSYEETLERCGLGNTSVVRLRAIREVRPAPDAS